VTAVSMMPDVGEQLLRLHNTQRRRDIKCERRIHQQQRPHSAARWGIDRQRHRAMCVRMYIGGEVGHVGEGDDGRRRCRRTGPATGSSRTHPPPPSLLLPTPPLICTWDRGSAAPLPPSAVGGLTRRGCRLGRRRSGHAAAIGSEDSDATPT
jgi:hypothetical protein